jgi:hypothetical protein
MDIFIINLARSPGRAVTQNTSVQRWHKWTNRIGRFKANWAYRWRLPRGSHPTPICVLTMEQNVIPPQRVIPTPPVPT